MNENYHLSSLDIDKLAQRFDKTDVVQALILMGSYARNEAGPNSDIDLIRFVIAGTKLSDNGTHLHENKILINISTVEPDEYEKWFIDPNEVTKWIAGLRVARVLIDRKDFFTNGLQIRAQRFVWDSTIQSRANIEASHRMVGWCEEAHKGLEGLRRNNDIGRLLNACHGLSWGLSEILQIQRGILVTSDNNVFKEVELALGNNTEMIELRRITFGVTGSYTLRQRVIAGLQFYVLLAEQMSDVWQADDIQIIEHTIKQIRNFVPNLFSENILNE
jgi:predicted nucleotidyltransferase